MKIDREKVLNKFGGKCAYCGRDLKGKFQADHIIPVSCFRNQVKNNYKIPEFLKHLKEWEVNHLDNIMPSCASCNNYKSSMDLESFRREIGYLVGRLNNTFNQYKIAKRYGLIEETKKEVKFYFETINK